MICLSYVWFWFCLFEDNLLICDFLMNVSLCYLEDIFLLVRLVIENLRNLDNKMESIDWIKN